jgi:hypothetical protein
MRNHVLGICFVALLTISCNGKKEIAPEAPVAEETVVVDVRPAALPVVLPAVIIADGASLFTELEPGIMTFKESLRLGTALEVRAGEKKTAVRASDKAERDFYPVLNQGSEYWIQEYALAPNAVPAVVISATAILYTRPDLAGVSSNAATLPQYEIVGLHPADSTNDFFCVSAYINDRSIDKQYIKIDTLTSDMTDVQVMQLYRIASAAPNEAVKKEILNNALSLGGIFHTMVSDALGISNGGSSVSSSPITFTRNPRFESFEGLIISDDGGKVNVRSEPGTSSSTVLFTLNPGDIIDVIAATNETETLSGISDRWFQINEFDGGTGWVFGAYISD